MSDFKLYEITGMLLDTLSTISKMAEENEGVIEDSWSIFLDEVQMERDKKVLDIGRFIKALKAEAKAVGEEKDRLTTREKALTTKADWLRMYLASNLQPGEAPKDANTQISWRRSSSVEIVDCGAIPDFYVKIERIPNKTAIREDLENGKMVPGAKMTEKQNIQIR